MSQPSHRSAELRKFVAPEFIFGHGARQLAGEYAVRLGAHKVLVVSDPGVVAAGWTGQVIASLQQQGLTTELFVALTENPKAAEVAAGVDTYLASGCNAIVAVGGGSPIDCAKGIGIVAANGGSILDYEGVDRIHLPMPPLLCIPTTCGSSSDVSQFAIITDPHRATKMTIVSKALVPDLALIDPETLTTLSPQLVAATALDALTHAVEAYVSNAASPVTDLHALEAVRLLGRHLLPALAAPKEDAPWDALMLASLNAGLAFSNAILGAVHALAHSLGGRFDLPHGECNALLLEHVIAFNLPAAGARYAAVAQALGLDLTELSPEEKGESLVTEIRRLRIASGMTQTLGDFGVTRADLPALSANALRDPCLLTNPRPATLHDLEKIYAGAL